MSTDDRDEDAKEDMSLYLPTQEDFDEALERRGDAEAEKNARENIRLQDALADLSKDLLPGEDPLFRFDERTRAAMKRRVARMGMVLEFPRSVTEVVRYRAMVKKAVEEIEAKAAKEMVEAATVAKAAEKAQATVSPTGNDAPKLLPLAEMHSELAEAAPASIAVMAPAPAPPTELAEAEPAATSWQQAAKRQPITSRLTNVQARTPDPAVDRAAVTEEPPPLVQTGAPAGEPTKPRGAMTNAVAIVAIALVLFLVIWAWQRAPRSAAQQAPEPVAMTSAPTLSPAVVAAPMPSAASSPATNAEPAKSTPQSTAIPKVTTAPRVKVIAPSKAHPEPVPTPVHKPEIFE